MKNTRLMEVLFSAAENNDEELTNQVAKDIEDAKANGVVDTDEVRYESNGDGSVSILDKGTGEVTVAENAEDEEGTYDLYPAEMDHQIEGFIHPEGDGVTPGNQVGAPDEIVENHMDGSSVISPNMPCGGLNPEAGNERSVEELAQMGPECCEDEEREFSVSTDNSVVLRIFSDQEFCERIFSEVIESEETAVIGDLKVEKVPDEENTVVVTNETTGDQAKVEMNDDEMEVTELNTKSFSNDEQYDALHVVGVDAGNHVIVDAPEYTEESASELVQRLREQGVDAIQVFDNPEDARDYAIQLLDNLGVESFEDVEEPEQVEFSDHTVYLTKFYSDNNDYMIRLFSESENDIEVSQSAIEDAIENGDQIETDTEVITPIDSKSAIVEDKESEGYTLVTLDGDEMDLKNISEEEAEELTDHLEADEEGEDEDEREYSDVYTNEEETKFFSEYEYMTDYMCRLFSEESDESAIEDAIENGDQIETDTEVITPIDSKSAVIEDKEKDEFTKAVMSDDDIDITPITKEEAEELTSHLEADEEGEDEDEREYSDVYTNEEGTKFFSENEYMTEYMTRLFSEESDESAIEDAIENGDQIETDTEVITPVDSCTAIVEDKDNGEFSKAVMSDDDIDITPITEEEADKLTEDLEVEDKGEDEDEREYSETENPVLDKYFSDALAPSQAPQAVGVQEFQVDADGNPIAPVPNPEEEAAAAPSIESVEDKALAAVQSIQAAASEAEAAILNAKAAPVQGAEQDLQEAQFSEIDDVVEGDTLVSWLNGTTLK